MAIALTRQKRVTFKAEGGISLAMMGREFSRSIRQEGDRLTMTSIDEPHAGRHAVDVAARPHDRPPVTVYRQTVGFWEHVVEQRVNVATGAVVSERGAHRASSSTRREVRRRALPYPEQEAIRLGHADGRRSRRRSWDTSATSGRSPSTRVRCFTTSLGREPGAESILRRYADIKDNELTVRLTPTGNQQAQTTTVVILRRLSGEAEMVPRKR